MTARYCFGRRRVRRKHDDPYKFGSQLFAWRMRRGKDGPGSIVTSFMYGPIYVKTLVSIPKNIIVSILIEIILELLGINGSLCFVWFMLCNITPNYHFCFVVVVVLLCFDQCVYFMPFFNVNPKTNNVQNNNQCARLQLCYTWEYIHSS